MISIERLTPGYEKKYEAFLRSDPSTLFYHSVRFGLFLKELLQADDHYFLAIEEGTVRGALPAFLISTPLGKSLNSLPFFGSNGGIIEFEGNKDIQSRLLKAFSSFAQENHCVASTIITSPFDKEHAVYASVFEKESPDDRRNGQITDLPQVQKDMGEKLFGGFDPFTRRMIRKAEKKGVTVREQYDDEALAFLSSVHVQNMERKGGRQKPAAFFSLFPRYFSPGSDYKLWVALKDNRLVAALLLFYFNRTVEYYVPAILEEYRSDQPQSLIIYRAMADAASLGYSRWNWGGTWPSQDGVYRFKKRWNTRNQPYYYYNQIYDQSLLHRDKQEILDAFPYSYTVPFDRLKGTTG